MKIAKKILLATMTALLAFGFTCKAFAHISYDGEKYAHDAVSFIENGATYVSARSLIDMREETSAHFDGESAHFYSDNLNIKARVGDNYITANGEVVTLGKNTVKLVDGRVSIPIRALAHVLGAEVTYDTVSGKIELKTERSYVGRERSYSEEDLYWMSRIIHAESSGEPYIGKLLVGDVILNRVLSEKFPNTVKAVIFDTKHAVQFTPVSNGTIYNTPCEDCIRAARAVLSGAVRSSVAMYFVNMNTVPVSWVSKNRPAILTVGKHTFFE